MCNILELSKREWKFSLCKRLVCEGYTWQGNAEVFEEGLELRIGEEYVGHLSTADKGNPKGFKQEISPASQKVGWYQGVCRERGGPKSGKHPQIPECKHVLLNTIPFLGDFWWRNIHQMLLSDLFEKNNVRGKKKLKSF